MGYQSKISSKWFSGRGRWNCDKAFGVLLLLVGQLAAKAEEGPSLGLPRDVPFTDHVHHHFSNLDGLPSDWIYDLVQARDGQLWIATHNGLARYDGLRFLTLNRGNTPQLPANDTRVLYESRDGSLWIGTVGGLTRYRPGRPGHFERFEAFDGNSVHAIFEDQEGNLWFGTREQTWVKRPQGEFEVMPDAPVNVRAFCEDAQGRLWLGTLTALLRRDDQEFVELYTNEVRALAAGTDKATAAVTVLMADQQGVWVGTSHGVLRVFPDGTVTHPQGAGQIRFEDFCRTRAGTVYAATGVGLFRLDVGDTFVALDTPERASCLMEDSEGGLWVGHTVDMGLNYYRSSIVRHWLTDQRVNCLHQDRRGDFWFGSYSGLHRWRDGEWTTYEIDDGLPDDSVQSIAQGEGEKLWIGIRKGLLQWTGTELVPVLEPNDLAGLNVKGIFVSREGVIWLTLKGGGARRWNKDGTLELIAELDHGSVSWIHEDSDGKLWIGHEYGLFQLSEGGIEEVTDPALKQLNSRHFTCHFSGQDGSQWFGTSGGIFLYRDGRFDAVTSEHGLAADYVTCIQGDSHGNLWFTGRDGIFYVSEADLHAVASGERAKLTSHRVQPVEGVPVTSYSPKSHLTADGTMWMVAKRGVIRVAPDAWESPTPPAVRIDQVRVDGRTIGADDVVRFTSGRHRLAIDFSVPTFRNRHDVWVKYRLEGSDDDWIEAGDERVAYYTDLTPGDYRFQVIAASGDSWNREGAIIDLLVQPRWWERKAVHVAASLGILGMFLLYARFRTRRYRRANIVLRREIDERKRAEEQSRRHQDELARVARAASMGEMATSIAHEIRQPLFAIMTDAKTATRLLQQEPLNISEIEEALEGIAQGGSRASEIVDRVRALVRKDDQPKHALDLNALLEKVIAFLKPELRRRSVVLETDLGEDLPTITGDEIQLQQVLINLIINGAQAMKSNNDPRVLFVSTRSDAESESVEISVRDCGIGFDESQMERLFEPFYTTKTSGIGMGLAINRTIIRGHGGQIWATSNDGPGATFHIRLPFDQQPRQEALADDE